MAKFDAITNESGQIKTSEKVLSIYPTLEIAPTNRFAELINGKVRLEFNNFRGTKNVYTKYYLELKDVRYLYERIKLCHMPEPLSLMKITGKSPMNEGPHKGKCWTATLVVRREAKSPSGEAMRNPWKIEMRNGYAYAVKQKTGGFRADLSAKSFTVTSREEMRLTDADMMHLFGSAIDYINAYKMVAAQMLIPKGEAELKKARQNSNYKGQAYTSESYSGYTQNVEVGEALPYESESTSQKADENVYPQKQEPAAQPEPETPEETVSNKPVKQEVSWHQVEIGFNSGFLPLNDGVMVAKCFVTTSPDKEWEIRFKNPSQIITDACNNSKTVNVMLAKGPDGRFWAKAA